MTSDGTRSWSSGLLVLAVGVLAVALFSYRDSYRELRAQLEDARPTVVRTRTVDRLVGATLPEIAVADPGGGEEVLPGRPEPHVTWLIRIDDCPGCLQQRLRRWNALVNGTGVRGTVVLAGVGSREARRIGREAGVRSRVLADSASRTFRALELDAPSVSVVTDGGGTVLLADARFYGTTRRCGWSFFDQVRALYGGRAPDRIRASPSPSERTSDGRTR